MNGNNRDAILHQPPQMEHSGSGHHHHHPVENVPNCDTVTVTSDEKNFAPMKIKSRLNCDNDTNDATDDAEKSASKNKTAMCLINELVRSNKVRCGAAIFS